MLQRTLKRPQDQMVLGTMLVSLEVEVHSQENLHCIPDKCSVRISGKHIF